MKIVFISNYYNHHQTPLSEAFYKLTEGNYRFIQTQTIGEERTKMEWGENYLPDFVIKSYESNEVYQKCVLCKKILIEKNQSAFFSGVSERE